MQRTLYTAGYGAGWTPQTLTALLDQTGAVLVDIRYQPWSRHAAWRKQALLAVFGPRYRHLRDLGNVNYRGGPLHWLDVANGVAQVSQLLTQYPAAVLLCGCRDHQTCHRTPTAAAIARQLADRWTIEIQPADPPAVGSLTNQPSLLAAIPREATYNAAEVMEEPNE